MQVLGVNWYLLQTTGSATKMGLGMVLQALPVLVLGPYAGALADRLRPRPLLVASQLTQAALAGAPALGWLSEEFGPRTALVFAGAVGLVACAAATRLLSGTGRPRAAAAAAAVARGGAAGRPSPVAAAAPAA